jgi:hypothetical protein
MRTHAITSSELSIHAKFLVAGATCCLNTNSQAVVDAIARVHRLTGQITSRAFQMNVLVDSSLRGDRDSAAHFRGMHHLVFALFGKDEMFSFDLSRNVAFGVVSLETAKDCGFWNGLVLPIAIGVLGATIGVVPLHAACLARNGKALMIVGPSGSGKSTLAMALSQRGFSLISDDWTYVSLDDNRLTAHGLRAPVKLLPDTVRYFPELRAFQPHKSLNGELAYEVEAQEVFGAEVKLKSRPSQIFFLRRVEGAGCDFTPFSGNEMKSFFESSAEQLPVEFAAAAANRSQAIDQLSKLGCWLLKTAVSPNSTAEAVERFYEGS